MCRWAVVSWPFQKAVPVYLILGEIYDPDFQDWIRLHRDLTYLTPFLYSTETNRTDIERDIVYLQETYPLTVGHRLIGKLPDSIIRFGFQRPVLYDLSCNIPVVQEIKRPLYKAQCDSVCLILPANGLTSRGEVAEEALSYGAKWFFVPTNSRLLCRYLFSRGVQKQQLILLHSILPNCLQDANELLRMLHQVKCELVIACSIRNIQNVGKAVRKWREQRNNDIQIKNIKFLPV